MSGADGVLRTLAEVTEVDELQTNLDIRLYDSHVLDSMKTVELMLALSDRFGLDISPGIFSGAVGNAPEHHSIHRGANKTQ